MNRFAILTLLLAFSFVGTVHAMQDTNANGMSDVWEKHYNAGNLFSSSDPLQAPTADFDGDGWSNTKEAIAGTNPFSAGLPAGWVRTTIDSNPASAGLFSISFPSKEGKMYRIAVSGDLVEWTFLPDYIDGTGNEIQLAIDASLEDESGIPERLFWRVAIADIDSDTDNLTDFEEMTLGLNAADPDTDTDGFNDDVDPDPSINPYAANPDGLGIPANLINGDLIGRWDFENTTPLPNPSDFSWGSAFFPDKTNNGRNGGVVNTGIDPQGMPSKAANHNRGFVGIPTSLLASRPIYTVSLWAKLPSDAIPSGQTTVGIFSNHTMEVIGVNNRRSVNALYITSVSGVETLRAGSYIYNSSPVSTTTDGVAISAPPGTWTDDKWHHYLYVCNDAQVLLYRDGILLGTDIYIPADIHINSTISGVSIGRFYGPAMGTIPNQSFGSTGTLKGQVDRVRVWKKALTAADALALYREDVSADGIDDLKAANSRLWRDENSDATRGEEEFQFLLDPFIHYGPQHDADNDGVSNLDEIALALNPSNPDTDGDLLPDGWEKDHGLNPKSAAGPNGATGDPDGDGFSNITEYGNKTNPGDSGSGSMDDIPNGDVISFKLGVGDRSGSHSEDYTMECYEFDPVTNAETHVYTLRSGGFGQYTEKTVGKPFRKGRSYTFKLNWQSSKLTTRPANPANGTIAEGPDYDYHFVVEPQGNHGGMIMDGYDSRAKRFDIARKILDPEDVEDEDDDDDDIPDLPNYFGHMRTLFRTLVTGGQLITPGGDSVNSPVENGDGANEFTFSSAAQGVLTINLKAKPTEGLPFDVDIAGKFKFQLDDIPGSTLTWSAGNEGGKAKKSGAFMIATATFTGLPANNSAFGKKTARLMAEGQQCDSKEYEIFFPKEATNHPGGQAGSRNWYHYWMQTAANHTNTTTEFSLESESGRSEYLLAARKIKLLPDASDRSVNAWGTPKGIDCFAWVSAHEAKHHTQLSGFWVADRDLVNDRDGDFIPNNREATYMAGRPYNPDNATTYPDDIGYTNATGDNIRDAEDIAMRTQTPDANGEYPLDVLWTNGNADAVDWANPGKNSKDKF